jgi:hypothetical protein
MTIFRCPNFSILVIAVTHLTITSPLAEARPLNDFIETLTRVTVNVPADVPIRYSDETLELLGRSKPVKNMTDNGIPKKSDFPDTTSDNARQAVRRDEILAPLRQGLEAHPQLLKRIETLDETSQQTALVLLNGGQRLSSAVPDIAIRSKLLRTGGGELVASAGLYGEDFVNSALRIQSALDAGALVSPASKRAITLADFSRTIGKMGQGGLDFFNKNIRPNWKQWLGSGLLAWWILDPEGFQDTAGKITYEGTKRINELAGDIIASSADGVVEGSANALRNIMSRARSTFREQGALGFAGIMVLLALGSLSFKRVRYYAGAPFRWLNRMPEDLD